MSDSFAAELWRDVGDIYAVGIVSAEMTLHQSLFAELGIDPAAAAGSPNPRYRQWIDTDAAEELGDEARDVIAVDGHLSRSEPERDRARRRCRATSRHEWMFWIWDADRINGWCD